MKIIKSRKRIFFVFTLLLFIICIFCIGWVLSIFGEKANTYKSVNSNGNITKLKGCI
jgi:hypothetical protein